mmetsp:Transcript_15492/g.24074  ORF Transcript_15492/g.24074 Transcript_15492/m.24074 type:complete len:204 (+) Transcript_15492:2108-2719(+)
MTSDISFSKDLISSKSSTSPLGALLSATSIIRGSAFPSFSVSTTTADEAVASSTNSSPTFSMFSCSFASTLTSSSATSTTSSFSSSVLSSESSAAASSTNSFCSVSTTEETNKSSPLSSVVEESLNTANVSVAEGIVDFSPSSVFSSSDTMRSTEEPCLCEFSRISCCAVKCSSFKLLLAVGRFVERAKAFDEVQPKLTRVSA